MPIHYGSASLHVHTISSTLATQIPHAVGAAFALKVRSQISLKWGFEVIVPRWRSDRMWLFAILEMELQAKAIFMLLWILHRHLASQWSSFVATMATQLALLPLNNSRVFKFTFYSLHFAFRLLCCSSRSWVWSAYYPSRWRWPQSHVSSHPSSQRAMSWSKLSNSDRSKQIS